MWPIFFVFCFVSFKAWGQLPDELAIVNITQGSVQGSLAVDGNYYEFHGIPYADSTSGTQRFKAPLPPPTFTDTFVANRKDIRCVRALGVGYEGTEDCLVVNVFTPTINETSALPVMVWVKGREFDGNNEFEISFKNLVEKEVVVVSLNFRESILGFLCLGTETAPGNAGLKDIIAALRWVQDNIAQFGGDPNSVTLLGHGSGAAAVDLVTLSPMAEGLVHRAIAQSGTSLSPWAVTRDPSIYAIMVAEAMGHTITDIESLSDAFTRISIAALMGVINELELTDNSLAFAPCIENEGLETEEHFLVKSPYKTIVDGDHLQIPIIIGYVENEGTIREDEALHHSWLEKMETSFTEFIQPDLEFENSEQEISVAQAIRSFYFQDEEISMSNIADYISYHGDTMILVSALREASLRVATSTSPVYIYQFSYQGQIGEPYTSSLSVVGAVHSEELAYLFDISEADEIPLTDNIVREIMIERWTNFAKTGIASSETSGVEWQPVTTEYTNVLIIRNEETNTDETTEQPSDYVEISLANPHQDILMFWDEIYQEHFIDAEGVWEPTIREDEDEEAVDETEEDGVTEDPIDSTEETDEALTDSAATAVGYTFAIMSVFAIFNHLIFLTNLS